MVVRQDKLKEILQACGFNQSFFAKILDIEESEVKKMLKGESIGYDTARKFVYFLKADYVQYLIDWENMKIKNPLEGAK